MRRREATGYLAVLVSLGALGLFAWISRQPQAPAIERLGRAPVIGPWVEGVRQRYLDAAAASAPSSRRRVGEPAAGAGPGEELDGEWIGLGASIRAAPSSDATVLATTRELLRYQVAERRGSWARVQLGGPPLGWIDLAAPRDLTPPLGMEPLPPGPLASRPADAERLTQAARLLGGPRTARLGGYELLTDVDDTGLIDRLDQRLRNLEERYRARYGLSPVGTPAETLVLFRRESDYLQFQRSLPDLRAIDSAGHAAGGIAAVFLEGRGDPEVIATMVHEVAHLLNRRAVGPALPPWLDEGMADDLAMSTLDDGAQPYERWRIAHEDHIEMRGPLAALFALRGQLRSGSLIPLRELLAEDQSSFLASASRSGLYDQSAFFVRYLVEREPPHGRLEAFRRFLLGVAAGGSPDAETLRATIGIDWSTLELDFRAWLLLESARAGLEAEPAAAAPSSPRALGPSDRRSAGTADDGPRSGEAQEGPSGSSSRQRLSPSA